MRILLIDDDSLFAEVLILALDKVGFRIDHAGCADDAVAVATYDAVLLDLNLPDRDGLDVCRRIRECSSVPIIILTARGALADKVTGLKRGADDYMVKPFSVVELLARLEAVFRRGRPTAPQTTNVLGRLTLEPDGHNARVDGLPIDLTLKEFHLLSVLVEIPGAVVRKDQLAAQVWRTAGSSTYRTLEVHISSLRTKLKAAATIETVRGVGYRFVARTEDRFLTAAPT